MARFSAKLGHSASVVHGAELGTSLGTLHVLGRALARLLGRVEAGPGLALARSCKRTSTAAAGLVGAGIKTQSGTSCITVHAKCNLLDCLTFARTLRVAFRDNVRNVKTLIAARSTATPAPHSPIPAQPTLLHLSPTFSCCAHLPSVESSPHCRRPACSRPTFGLVGRAWNRCCTHGAGWGRQCLAEVGRCL